MFWTSGGFRKILGILYADGSEIPKRSRQVVWRAAVQMSRNASQLALQVSSVIYIKLFFALAIPFIQRHVRFVNNLHDI